MKTLGPVLFIGAALALCLCGCSKPICTAAANGDVAEVKRILAKDPTQADGSCDYSRGYRPVQLAAENGHAEIVILLLDAGAATAYNNYSLMELAARNGHNAVVAVLLKRGLSINGNRSSSPLQAAAAAGRAGTVEFLLEHGANISEPRDDGCTALHYAALHGHPPAITVLLDRGANIEITDNNGWTPLFYAAAGGTPEAVAALLSRGAKVNARSKRGWTPLMRAVANGHATVLPVLLAHGADLNARNDEQDTALTLAEKENKPAIAAALREAASITNLTITVPQP
ncbi:MAG: hypothetical protein PCFJNLEI_01310 [Verrucomicrobiae bacterium]|nr:hypothetical protein [Verrucomicrobiae bacterium]